MLKLLDPDASPGDTDDELEGLLEEWDAVVACLAKAASEARGILLLLDV